MTTETKIRISRGEHQFASAHFLIDMNQCERLHGHNYAVTVELGGSKGADSTIIDFHSVNPVIKQVCQTLDHRILIAKEDERQELDITDEEVEVRFKTKRFLFPRSDCVLLPLKATTVENLSAYVAVRLAEWISKEKKNIRWLKVEIMEGAAQSAISRIEIKPV